MIIETINFCNKFLKFGILCFRFSDYNKLFIDLLLFQCHFWYSHIFFQYHYIRYNNIKNENLYIYKYQKKKKY